MYDLLIIGAGPAGMAAASTAAQHGLTVAVLDEQPAPGGQIYRGITETGPRRAAILGPDYLEGAALAEGLATSRADVIQGAVVWDIDTGNPFTVTYSCIGTPAQLTARALILATGALERPVPIPGWTLPGLLVL
ncbi:MAG: FAD-binding protein, partial [Rhodobacteraceae bacterium]|nr:FAD-binding protein [Paracoccaceae bacterium]